MTGSKERKSVTLDRDLVQTIDARDDINLSGLANDLLRSFFEGGSKNRALKVKLEKLREKEDRLEEELGEVKRQIQQIEEVIEERQEQIEPQIKKGIERVKSGHPHIAFDRESEFAIARAAKAGIPAKEYVDRLADALDGETWEEETRLKSMANDVLTFDAETFRETGDPDEAIQSVGKADGEEAETPA